MKEWKVYALRNERGDIIYIGISHEVRQRVANHKSSQPWRDEIANWDVLNDYETRTEALKAESRAIRDLRPPYNLADNPDRRYLIPRDTPARRTVAVSDPTAWIDTCRYGCKCIDWAQYGLEPVREDAA